MDTREVFSFFSIPHHHGSINRLSHGNNPEDELSTLDVIIVFPFIVQIVISRSIKAC